MELRCLLSTYIAPVVSEPKLEFASQFPQTHRITLG